MIARGLQVLLLTAQRSGEVFTMKWEDLDLVDGWENLKLVSGWWTISATRSKNKQAHRVPLVPRVVDLLREAKATRPVNNRWVFGGEKDGSVAARASKAMRELRRAEAIDFDVHRHDLRRTAATEMGRAGVQRTTIAHVLNHVDRGSRATQIYDRYDHDAEKRVALETWARRLDEVLTARAPVRVVAFARS
jgi:integrase